MNLFSRAIRRFSVRDLVLIAVMAAVGIAVKQVVRPLVQLVSSPLMIPGGALAGGLYMMWLVVAEGLTGKRGTATFVGLVQAVIVMFTGAIGSHGIMSLLSYTAPGIAVDIAMAVSRHRCCCLPCMFVAGLLANVAGTVVTNLIFFSLPIIPLLLSLAVAALSGGIGGVLSHLLLSALRKYNIGVRTGGVDG